MPTRRCCDEQGTLVQQVRHFKEAVAQLQVRQEIGSLKARRVVCWQEGIHIKVDCRGGYRNSGRGGSDMNNLKGEGAGGGCAPSRAKRGSF